MSSTRQALYAAARILGTLNAILTGRIARRATNIAIGRHAVAKMWRR